MHLQILSEEEVNGPNGWPDAISLGPAAPVKLEGEFSPKSGVWDPQQTNIVTCPRFECGSYLLSDL
jgi:hypothetical protein